VSDDKPILHDYPAQYQFKAMGLASDEFVQRVRALVESVLGPLDDSAIARRPSSAGKYVSVQINVVLKSEEQRRAVYHAFHGDKSIVWYV
jgi:putative lipoic acid-binding regulatory protein